MAIEVRIPTILRTHTGGNKTVEGSDRPERFIPMHNAARSPTFYEFDSGDLLKLYRDMDDRDEVPVVIYHSHTATEAHPSRTDISYASEPEVARRPA